MRIKWIVFILAAVLFQPGDPASATEANPKVNQKAPLNISKTAEPIIDVSKQPVLKLPDLTIESMTFTPANPKVGDTATFAFAVKNIGPGDAGATNAVIYSLPKPFSVPMIALPPLASGASKAYSYSAQLNDQSPGKYLIGIDLNLNSNPITELPTKNNYKTIEVTVAPASTQLPDLTFVVLKLNPASPVSGGPAVLSFSLKNIGKSPSAPTTVEIIGHAGAIAAFGLPASVNIPGLEPGQVSPTINFSPPGNKLSLPPGSYGLNLKVNPNNNLKELTTTNNGKSLSFKVTSPKLEPPKPGAVVKPPIPMPLPPNSGAPNPPLPTPAPPGSEGPKPGPGTMAPPPLPPGR